MKSDVQYSHFLIAISRTNNRVSCYFYEPVTIHILFVYTSRHTPLAVSYSVKFHVILKTCSKGVLNPFRIQYNFM